MTRALLLFFTAILMSGHASASCRVSPFTSSGYEQDGKEIVMQGAQADFDTSPLGLGNPPGCRCYYQAVACRSDGKPVAEYHVDVVERVGRTSTVESTRVGSCVRHSITLGVDHSGLNGRVCRAPAARMTLRTIFSVEPIALPPVAPPDPRDAFEPAR